MYHPDTPCIPQFLRCWGFSCTITFIPGGTSGDLLKSNYPSSIVYADIVRFCRQGLIIFIFIVDCVISQHHRCIGKRVSMIEVPAMKWSFHVLMARSTALTWWICGGNNWYSISFCLCYLLRLAGASLSNQWTRVMYPIWVRCSSCLV